MQIKGGKKRLVLPPSDFFIAFYISFPFLIVALEIASSSIVANGACLKKKDNSEKGLESQ